MMARHFTNWLEAYMQYAEVSEAPDQFHQWTAIATIAGALRRQVWIPMPSFEWSPNFYIVIVAPPGVATKSTAMGLGISLLEQIPDVHFGPDSVTPEALAEALAEASRSVKFPDPKTMALTSFFMCAITCAISELGTFMKSITEGNEKMVSSLTDWWDGKITKRNWTHRTKTAGITEIRNPWVNIIGCTTPTWVTRNIPTSMIGEGLTSRIVFVYGNSKRRLIPYPDEVVLPETHADIKDKLLSDLKEIAQIKGIYTIDTEARLWGKQWYNELWLGDIPVHLASERYEGYRSRKYTHLHKLAIVIAASQRNEKIITLPDMLAAHEMLLSAEPSMGKVFESIGLSQDAKRTQEMISFVRVYKRIEVNQLKRLCFNLMTSKDFNSALLAGLKSKILSTENIGGIRYITLGEPT